MRRRGSHGSFDQVFRRRLLAAAIAAGLIAIVFYVAFGPGTPFDNRAEITGEVRDTSSLRAGSPVRIAGLDVGEVTGVRPGADDTSVVVMELDSLEGLHADATFTIAPRLVLEGNSYVALQPGRPSSRALRDGDRIPAGRTAGSVGLDQVLSTLTAPTRGSLQASIRELGSTLGPAPGRDRGSSSGTAALRRSVHELERTLPVFTRVARAARGLRPGDLPRAIQGSGDIAAQLAADPRSLGGLVRDYDRTIAALGARQGDLRAGVVQLAATLEDAPTQLRTIDAALPPLERYVARARPALRRAPPALRATSAALRQIELASGPTEIPELLSRLRPLTARLPSLTRELETTMPLVTMAAACVARNVVPTLNKEVPDGRLSSGRPAWQDLLHMAAALTGTSPGFDGNGGTLRISLAEGANAVRGLLPGVGPVVSAANLEGVRPVWLGPGKTPPYRPDARCLEQALPDLGKRAGAGLPAGLRRVPQPTLNAREARDKLAIARGLHGTARDRRELLSRLLARLPRLAPTPQRRRTRPPDRSRRRPERLPQAPPGTGSPAPATPGLEIPAPPELVGPITDLLDRALGGLTSGGGR